MRVMVWQEVFWPAIGGAEVMATKLLLALKHCGYEFVVVTRQDRLDQPGEDEYQGIPVYRFPFWSVLVDGDVAAIMRMRQEVAKLKRSFAPAIVHVNSFGPSAFFHVNTTNAHPAPYLVTLHSENNLADRGFPRDFLRSADWVVGCSNAILEFATRLAPEIKLRSSVIYNGLEPPEFLPGALPLDPPRLLCVGRVVAEKGFDLAVSAVAALTGRFPNLRLTIAGDGPARRDLERQAARLGIADRVDFVGWLAPDSVGAIINKSTSVLMPSTQEAFPLVALEAGLIARPVVASRTGGFLEIIVHGETGLLVNNADPRGFVDAVAYLLDNPETARRLGQAARKRICGLFSLQRHVEAYGSLYNELVANRCNGNDQSMLPRKI